MRSRSEGDMGIGMRSRSEGDMGIGMRRRSATTMRIEMRSRSAGDMSIGGNRHSGSDGSSWLGQMLGAAGGPALLGSLWLPWYTGRAPQAQSAWQTFTAMPAVLLVTAAFVTVLSALQLCERAGDTSRLAMLAGALTTVLVGYRFAMPPLSGMHSAWGLYIALGSGVTLLAGGILAAVDRSLPEIAVPAISLGQAPTPGLPARPAS